MRDDIKSICKPCNGNILVAKSQQHFKPYNGDIWVIE